MKCFIPIILSVLSLNLNAEEQNNNAVNISSSQGGYISLEVDSINIYSSSDKGVIIAWVRFTNFQDAIVKINPLESLVIKDTSNDVLYYLPEWANVDERVNWFREPVTNSTIPYEQSENVILWPDSSAKVVLKFNSENRTDRKKMDLKRIVALQCIFYPHSQSQYRRVKHFSVD